MRIERAAAYHNADDLGYTTMGTAAADVQTGAWGPASRREFDPESAGGPVRQIDAGKAKITNEGVQEVVAHLPRFTGGGPLDTPEQGMLDDSRSGVGGRWRVTETARPYIQ